MKFLTKTAAIGAGSALIAGALFLGALTVNANPSFFAITAQTSSATTTPTFMQAATATTTVAIYDSYDSSGGSPTKTSDAALLLQLGATSTPTFNIAYEYAQGSAGVNCVTTPLACDWYADNYLRNPAANPNTASIALLTTITASSATSSVALNLPTPTRYVRVRAKLTGAPGSVWAQIVPNKQYK